jgi:hypothetical protein
MTRRSYQTVAVDLVEHADAFADHFEKHGYKCTVEKTDLEFPYVPTLLLVRPPTTLIIEVNSRIIVDRLEHWSRYCSSCSKDTRVALGLPPTAKPSARQIARLSRIGVGLYLIDAGTVNQLAAPRDLALKVSLPDLDILHPRVRKLLGAVYEQFEQSMWREGFYDACQAVEAVSRKYLKRHLKREMQAGRAAFVKPNGTPINRTQAQIDKMTLGQLAHAFESMPVQNHADSIVTQGLKRLNRDRVGVAHFKTKPATERRLRDNVGRHMYTVIGTLKALVNVT